MPDHADIPKTLAIIAGKGAYPRLLAGSARDQGVEEILVVAFRGETDPTVSQTADRVLWFRPRQMGEAFDALREAKVHHAVMAGQITPAHLFRTRLDGFTLDLLKTLRHRNAQTIFGAVAERLAEVEVHLLPASRFMESHLAAPGLLSARSPSETESRDIAIGLRAARTTSELDIGQTVAVKEGTILAVEAFEGTDKTIRRAARLGGHGVVVVKAAKPGHDMRFDIPVVGTRTIRLLRKVHAGALAVEAGRCILLEREKVIELADQANLAMVAVEGGPSA
ncbi:MAG: LpxI family protein [Lentisphaerae bacterium]|nr:LpxI family protein [Lentisphaerota bacterium]